jgi:hypothetical protein
VKFPTLTLSFAKPALDESLGEEHGFLFRSGAMRVDPHGLVLEGFPVGSSLKKCQVKMKTRKLVSSCTCQEASSLLNSNSMLELCCSVHIVIIRLEIQ